MQYNTLVLSVCPTIPLLSKIWRYLLKGKIKAVIESLALREASQSHLRIMDPTSIMCERLIKKKERKKERKNIIWSIIWSIKVIRCNWIRLMPFGFLSVSYEDSEIKRERERKWKEEWRDLKDIKPEVNVRALSMTAINEPSLLSAIISTWAKPAAGGELTLNHLASSLCNRFHFKRDSHVRQSE